jgi:hypothetical protein
MSTPAISPAQPTPGAASSGPCLASGWHIRCGIAAMLVWLLLFGAGVLIDSLPYRQALGWGQTAKTELQTLSERIEALETRSATPAPPPAAPAPAKTDTAADPSRSQPAASWQTFLLGLVTYLPINVGLLSIVAAFLGGCSVSPELIQDIRNQMETSDRDSEEHYDLKRRLHYLTEHPAYSAFRGLVVYLLVTSGLLVFAGAETLTTTPDQIDSLGRYIRYAGIFSFIGYLAGHDPTVFSGLLRLGSSRMQFSKTPPRRNGAPATEEVGRKKP